MKRMFDENEIIQIASKYGGNVNKLDLVVGEPTVTYDTTNGIVIKSTGKLNDEKDITVSNEIPILPGKGIVMDKPADKEVVEVKVDINEAAHKDNYKNSIAIGNYTSVWADGAINIGNSSYTDYAGQINIGTENVIYGAPGTYHPGIVIGNKIKTDISQKHIIVLGNYNDKVVSGDRFILADGEWLAGSKQKKHTYFRIYTDGTNYYMDLNGKEVPTQFKTIFGNQSLSGTGNIDLYKHSIKGVSGNSTFYLRLYSSNNLQVSSLTDLKTLLGDTFEESATGSNGIIAITNEKVLLADGTDALISGYTITDTVTTI